MNLISHVYSPLVYFHDAILKTREVYHPAISVSYQIALLIVPFSAWIAGVLTNDPCRAWPAWVYYAIAGIGILIAHALSNYFIRHEHELYSEFKMHSNLFKTTTSITMTLLVYAPYFYWAIWPDC